MSVIRVTPVKPGEDGGTGHLWEATWGPNEESVDYDASGVTIEATLAELARVLGEALKEERDATSAAPARRAPPVPTAAGSKFVTAASVIEQPWYAGPFAICECGHSAVEHYDGHDLCTFGLTGGKR